MKKQNCLSVFVAVCLVLQSLIMTVAAVPEKVEGSASWVNPAYAHLVTDDITDSEYGENFFAEEVTTWHSSVDAIVAVMQEKMANRETEITFGMTYALYSQLANTGIDILQYLFDTATAHDPANPKGGDYVYWNMTGWYGGYSGDSSGITFVYTLGFLTTAEEEKAVDEKVNELVSQWEVMDLSEYEAVCEVYGYITENVTYDYNGLAAGDPKAHSTYKALVEGTSVCQGYSTLFYRLALEMGLDARVVSSIDAEDHGWNIVKLGDVYYNIDATWDAGISEANYEWFLKSMAGFPQHTRAEKYLTEAFMTEYPMSAVNYGETAPVTPAGDLNGDGTFDQNDVTMISAYFAGKYATAPFDTAKADFNSDGRFTRADGMYLARALAGWAEYTIAS